MDQMGHGDDTFQVQRTLAVGYSPRSIAVADVNCDGKPDLMIADHDDDSVSELLGNGDGTFQHQQPFKVGSHPIWVTVADVNGDGKTDFMTANFVGNSVSVLLGTGTGSFVPVGLFIPPVLVQPREPLLVDVLPVRTLTPPLPVVAQASLVAPPTSTGTTISSGSGQVTPVTSDSSGR